LRGVDIDRLRVCDGFEVLYVGVSESHIQVVMEFEDYLIGGDQGNGV